MVNQSVTNEGSESKITFYRGEDEEGNYSVVQAAGRLGDTGQDGERVQQVTVRQRKMTTASIFIHAVYPV